MRKVETMLYNFNELSEDVKEKALNKHRGINVDCDWWDCTISNLVDDCADVGVIFKESDVYFSILGRDNHIGVDSRNLSFDWYSEIDLPKKFGAFQNYLGGGMVGRIQSEEIEVDRVRVVEEGENDDNIVENLNSALELFEEALKSLWREYEYLTSDDVVTETLIANDYEFDNDGKIV